MTVFPEEQADTTAVFCDSSTAHIQGGRQKIELNRSCGQPALRWRRRSSWRHWPGKCPHHVSRHMEQIKAYQVQAPLLTSLNQHLQRIRSDLSRWKWEQNKCLWGPLSSVFTHLQPVQQVQLIISSLDKAWWSLIKSAEPNMLTSYWHILKLATIKMPLCTCIWMFRMYTVYTTIT